MFFFFPSLPIGGAWLDLTALPYAHLIDKCQGGFFKATRLPPVASQYGSFRLPLGSHCLQRGDATEISRQHSLRQPGAEAAASAAGAL